MSKVKCSYADQYKATRAPTCGCEVCGLKWELAQARRRHDLDPESVFAVIERNWNWGKDEVTRAVCMNFAAPVPGVAGYGVKYDNYLCTSWPAGDGEIFDLEDAESYATFCGGRVHKLVDGGPI